MLGRRPKQAAWSERDPPLFERRHDALVYKHHGFEPRYTRNATESPEPEASEAKLYVRGKQQLVFGVTLRLVSDFFS